MKKKRARNFREAAQISRDERWYPISKAKSIKEMEKIFVTTECELCQLQIRRYGKIPIFISTMPKTCGKCPLYLGITSSYMPCCDEFYRWDDCVSKGNLRKALKEAHAIVKLLEDIVNK